MKIVLKHKILDVISEIAFQNKSECYVVGGFVRDTIMKRPNKDIDILVVGSGIELAEKVAEKLKCNVHVFKNFGTAQIKTPEIELEFVGARKESYNRNSRKPIVENGTLEDDLNRRDFTINAIAASLNPLNYGEVIDKFNGINDIDNCIIRTPLEPSITFSDDPLRMMRAIRFASQLGFTIEEKTKAAISENTSRLEIISVERMTDEFTKILLSAVPSYGIELMDECGLLPYFIPELLLLKGAEYVDGQGHKDNFSHTLQVVDNVRKNTDNEWLLWTALLHDIAKPKTKRFSKETGWTFHGHEIAGSKMAADIFRRIRLPMGEPLRYVRKLISLHLRPASLTEEEITDSAVRRLLFEAGNDIEDLMILAEADITSKNKDKVQRYLANFALLKEKMKDVEERDRLRNWQPPVTGEEIMQVFALPPCKTIGDLKNALKEAILNGEIKNDRKEAWVFLINKAAEMSVEVKEKPMEGDG
jgi:poly(A) polymerase